METCPRCNNRIYADDLFCGQCGFNIMAQQSAMSATQKELKLSDIQLSLGIVYFKKGEYPKAKEIFQKIVESDSGNNHAHRLLTQANQLLEKELQET